MFELHNDSPFLFVLELACSGESVAFPFLFLLRVALLSLYLPFHETYDFFDIVFEPVL